VRLAAGKKLGPHEIQSPLGGGWDDGQIFELALTICMATFTNRSSDATRAVPDLGV